MRATLGQDDWFIYAAGGKDCNGEAINAVEKFDVTLGGWNNVNPLSFPRMWLGLIAIPTGNITSPYVRAHICGTQSAQ